MTPARLVTFGGVPRHTEPFGRLEDTYNRITGDASTCLVFASGPIVVGHYRHEEDEEDERHG
jgi:hypothetical protein